MSRPSGTLRRSSARIGVFFTLVFLFLRILPVISNYEMRELIVKKGSHPSALVRRRHARWRERAVGAATAGRRPAGEEALP